MARKDESNLLSRVTTVLTRLDDPTAPKLPAALATDVKAFRVSVGPFVTASVKASASLGVRDSALAKVGEADAVLDVSVDDLADACVGAKLGGRSKPFAGLSPHSPSKLQNLGYKKEVDAVGDLLGALAKKSPPASVKSVAGKVEKNAAAVQKLLDAVTGPEAGYVKARTLRDSLAPDASKALGRFKLRAKAALLDDPGTYEALFGARAAVQAPTAKPRRKAKVAVAKPGEGK